MAVGININIRIGVIRTKTFDPHNRCCPSGWWRTMLKAGAGWYGCGYKWGGWLAACHAWGLVGWRGEMVGGVPRSQFFRWPFTSIPPYLHASRPLCLNFALLALHLCRDRDCDVTIDTSNSEWSFFKLLTSQKMTTKINDMWEVSFFLVDVIN